MLSYVPVYYNTLYISPLCSNYLSLSGFRHRGCPPPLLLRCTFHRVDMGHLAAVVVGQVRLVKEVAQFLYGEFV